MTKYKRWYDYDPMLLEVIEMLRFYQDELREQAKIFLEKVEKQAGADTVNRFYETVKLYRRTEGLVRLIRMHSALFADVCYPRIYRLEMLARSPAKSFRVLFQLVSLFRFNQQLFSAVYLLRSDILHRQLHVFEEQE